MVDFSKFEDLGMEVVSTKPTHKNNHSDIVLKLVVSDTGNRGSASISILQSTFEIMFTSVRQRVRFIVAPKTNRIYFVADDSGAKFTWSQKTGGRCYAYSKPLGEAMKKYGYCKVYEDSIKFDKDLNAYYVEVESIR